MLAHIINSLVAAKESKNAEIQESIYWILYSLWLANTSSRKHHEDPFEKLLSCKEQKDIVLPFMQFVLQATSKSKKKHDWKAGAKRLRAQNFINEAK